MRVKGRVVLCTGDVRALHFEILLAHHAFSRNQVRLRAAQAIGLVGAMEVDHEVILGRQFNNAMIEATIC